MTANRLSLRQKRSLYRDGCVVLPGVIHPDRVAAARRLILERLGRSRTPASKDTTAREPRRGQSPLMLGLFNDTPLRTILEEALGPVHAQRGCQVATRLPSAPSEHVNEAGYRDADTPFLGWHGHLDGLWNGAAPMHQDVSRPMTAEEHDAWHKEPSRNGCLKCHPDSNVNITNFAALVGVALSDQTDEGVGNVGVLKGAHHEMERFFRGQRDAGGPLGPDGPGWPRVDIGAPNASGLRHYPDAVRDAYRPHGVETADGRFWPEPTLVRMAAGDAVLVLHAVPHCATRVAGPEPRLMAYFRIMPARRPSANRSIYPEALCDIWHEWPGMADVVAEQRGAE